jgi:lysophospholipase L1-like esterase
MSVSSHPLSARVNSGKFSGKLVRLMTFKIIAMIVMLLGTNCLCRASEADCDAADLFVTTTASPPTTSANLRRFQQYVQQAPTEINKIIIGDSIAELWARLPQPGGPILDLGIAADRIQNILWRVQSDELRRFKPKQIVLLAGTNNLGADKTCAVVAGLNNLIQKIRLIWPSQPLLIIGILPRGDAFKAFAEKRVEINKQLSSLAGGNQIRFIDVSDDISCHWTEPCENYISDKEHMSAKGNAVLTSAILNLQ